LVGTVDGGSASQHSSRSSSAHSSSTHGAAGIAAVAAAAAGSASTAAAAAAAASAAAGGVGGVVRSGGMAPWLRLVVSAGPAAGRRFETCNQAQEVRVCALAMHAGSSCNAVTYVRTAGVLPCCLPGGQHIMC
jgi:hypothetical protein